MLLTFQRHMSYSLRCCRTWSEFNRLLFRDYRPVFSGLLCFVNLRAFVIWNLCCIVSMYGNISGFILAVIFVDGRTYSVRLISLLDLHREKRSSFPCLGTLLCIVRPSGIAFLILRSVRRFIWLASLRSLDF